MKSCGVAARRIENVGANCVRPLYGVLRGRTGRDNPSVSWRGHLPLTGEAKRVAHQSLPCAKGGAPNGGGGIVVRRPAQHNSTGIPRGLRRVTGDSPHLVFMNIHSEYSRKKYTKQHKICIKPRFPAKFSVLFQTVSHIIFSVFSKTQEIFLYLLQILTKIMVWAIKSTFIC